MYPLGSKSTPSWKNPTHVSGVVVPVSFDEFIWKLKIFGCGTDQLERTISALRFEKLREQFHV
jgi:hypothetical protein